MAQSVRAPCNKCEPLDVGRRTPRGPYEGYIGIGMAMPSSHTQQLAHSKGQRELRLSLLSVPKGVFNLVCATCAKDRS